MPFDTPPLFFATFFDAVDYAISSIISPLFHATLMFRFTPC